MRNWLDVLPALGILGFLGSCDTCPMGSRVQTTCATGGSANGSLVVPPAAPSTTPVQSTKGKCKGGCATYFEFWLDSDLFHCLAQTLLGAPTAPQTLTFPSNVVFISCALPDNPGATLSPRSGTMTIQAIDAASMSATFSINFARDDGATIETTNGSVSISACHDDQVCY